MKVITWNVNSIRLRSSLIYRLLEIEKPDILCLQECKSLTEQMSLDLFEPLGYLFSASWGQKSYNGVAFISKIPLEKIEKIDFLNSKEARHISVVINGITIHNFYFPAGGDIPDINLNIKISFKLEYIKEENFLTSTNLLKSILVGDLNIAPEIDDVWDHKKLLNVVSHTPDEVNLLKEFQTNGSWVDIFRKHKS